MSEMRPKAGRPGFVGKLDAPARLLRRFIERCPGGDFLKIKTEGLQVRQSHSPVDLGHTHTAVVGCHGASAE